MPLPPPARVAERSRHFAIDFRPDRAPWSLALIAGAALSFAFAPFNQWWLAIVAPAVLMLLWARAPDARAGARLGFWFGLGLYAAGTWWLYISIRIIGNAPVVVALGVMACLVLIMAAYQALLGYVVCRWLAPWSLAGRLLLVPGAWVLLEWWRGWFLTGFPWLSLGYSQTDTWLAGLAPVGGVPLITLALLMGAGALQSMWLERGARWAVALVALLLPWTLGLWLRDVQWTAPAGESRSIAIVQGAIPQDQKWLKSESNRQDILDTYERLHREALGARLIVWPESALPDVANRYGGYLSRVWSESRNAGSDVVIGVMRAEADGPDEEPRYYNSILALGEDAAFYDKRQLVPFGEVLPVPSIVRRWLRLMELPADDFTVGARHQQPFAVAGTTLAASICYEAAYPALLRREAGQAEAMVTVSNDGWFGRSPARYLHLQIGRMRAIEARRYLLRAANDGVSAIVGPDGRVRARAAEFEPVVLRGEFTPRQGSTPYLATGNWPVLCGLLLLLLGRGAALIRRARGPIQGA